MKDRIIRAKLIDNVIPENETFEQQMKDLDVPIEKKSAKALTGWIKARNCGEKNAVKEMRISTTVITFSPKATKLFELEKGEYRFAVCIVDFEGKPALLFKPDAKGIKLKHYGGQAYQAAITKPIGLAFAEHGVKKGCYTINAIKNGYLAVPENE